MPHLCEKMHTAILKMVEMCVLRTKLTVNVLDCLKIQLLHALVSHRYKEEEVRRLHESLYLP